MKAAARKKATFLKESPGKDVEKKQSAGKKVKNQEVNKETVNSSSKVKSKKKVQIMRKRLKLFSEKGMAWLDERLSIQSYLLGPKGYVASAEDCAVYNALKAAGRNLSEYKNILRWYRNIRCRQLTHFGHYLGDCRDG